MAETILTEEELQNILAPCKMYEAMCAQAAWGFTSMFEPAVRKKYDMPRGPYKSKITQETKDFLQSLRDQGHSIPEITKLSGYSKWTVQKYTCPTVEKRGRNRLNQELIDQIKALREQGYSQEEVTQMMNISLSSVRRYG